MHHMHGTCSPNMPHMCLLTIYKIKIFIYGSVHTYWWHTCTGYMFALVHRSTNSRMQHHRLLHLRMIDLRVIYSGPQNLMGLESIERVMPPGCTTRSWLYTDIRCNHVKGWNRTVLPSSAGHPSGRPMSAESLIWMNSYGQSFNPKLMCCWIMALHGLKHFWSQIEERYQSMCGCTVRWDTMGLIHESSDWRWKSGKPWEPNQHVILTMSHVRGDLYWDPIIKKSRRDDIYIYIHCTYM